LLNTLLTGLVLPALLLAALTGLLATLLTTVVLLLAALLLLVLVVLAWIIHRLFLRLISITDFNRWHTHSFLCVSFDMH
jgi:hypothetical protein